MPTTKYLWDDETDNVVMETDEAGDVTAEYTHAPGRYGRLLSQHRDGQTSHYHYDGNGNTRALTDENQDVTDTYTYTAFGDEVATTGTTPNRYRFGGQYGYQTDEATGQISVRERVYEPQQGRWTSKDPLRFIDAVNPYLYAGNGPTNSIDPSGLQTEEIAEDLGRTIGVAALSACSFGVGLALVQAGNCRTREYETPTISIISWIEKTKGAPLGLNRSANKEPRPFFQGPAWNRHKRRRRDTSRARIVNKLSTFLNRKEFRNFQELRFDVQCKCGKVAGTDVYAREIVGYTPVRLPKKTFYSKGKAGRKDLRKKMFANDACFSATSTSRFRIGALGNAVGRILTGYYAPWAWSQIHLEFCCNTRKLKIEWGGSYISSHTLYEDGGRIAQHSMARQKDAKKRLDWFISTGDGKDGPGSNDFFID